MNGLRREMGVCRRREGGRELKNRSASDQKKERCERRDKRAGDGRTEEEEGILKFGKLKSEYERLILCSIYKEGDDPARTHVLIGFLLRERTRHGNGMTNANRYGQRHVTNESQRTCNR